MFSVQIVKASFVCANWTEFKLYPALPTTIDICQIGKNKSTTLHLILTKRPRRENKLLYIRIYNISKYIILF